MSILLESALEGFTPAEGELVAAEFATEAVLDAPLPLDVVEQYVEHHEWLAHGDDAVVLPLHGREDAELTGEYVLYRDHDLRGTLFGGRDAHGEIDWVPADDLARAPIAARLRFWHPDYVPPERPSYLSAAVDAVEPARNPLPDEATFVEGLREFVAEERAAARAENYERAASQHPAERYADDGDAVPAAACLGEADGCYRFRVQDAPAVGFRVEHADPDRRGFLRETFGLHEGNEVLVHAPDGVERAFPVRGTVVETEGRDLTVDVAWEAVAERTVVERVLRRQGDGFGLTPLLNPVPFDRELDAVDAIEGTPLGAILAGQAPLTFEDDAKAASESLDDDLNQDQHRAVEHALLADRLFCIHGPPGTGKTRTLVEIVRRSVQAGRRVLVCADSNQAVDNLLVGASTADEVDEGSIHGYGQHGTDEFTVARANARRSSNDLVQAAYGGVPEASADVVAATNSSAARLHGSFDLLVLDEATQATCSSSCVPLANAEKVVLAGDHQQLPPYSATESPAASSYGLSLFEHVYAEGGVYEGVGIQLRTQYRMHRDIAYLPNRLFYDGSLRAGRTVDPLSGMPAIEAHSLGGSEESVGHSWRNPTEARLVGHLVGRLLEQGLGGEDVGVITPYSGQVREIESVLASVDGAASVVVDTIDAFQGSERAAIVISFVRSNPAGDVGFLGRSADGRRRLNVAMTRAKRHCSLVGDWHTLRGHRREEPPHECVDTYREIYRQLENTGRLRTPDPTLLPEL